MHEADPRIAFALALAAGVVGQMTARHLRIPSIVPLLGLGVVMGPDLLGWVQPRALGEGLFVIVELAVAIILFEGGLNLEFRRLRRENRPIRMLVSVGALVTAAGGAVAARLLLGWSWDLSLLFGTLVIVTGPTVIGPLLRNVPVRPRLATVLEAEGILIDPIGAVVAAVTLPIIVGAENSFAPGVQGLLIRLGFGAVAGLVLGFALAGLLRARRVVPEGLENITALGAALVIFEGCNVIVSDTGILAVTVAGIVVGNVKNRVSRELRDFQEHLTIGLIGVLFVLLAADVGLVEVRALGRPGLAVVAALILVVRPLNVWVSTVGSELDWRERAYLCWIAPRGIVAAGIASLFATVLDDAGIDGGSEMRALVFLTIAVTVVVQGGTAGLVARLLGVRVAGRETVTVLGAEELALKLGDVLTEGGRRVLFIDGNPGHCRAAQERGFQVVFGNALEERTLARARLERTAAAIGLTPNDEVNSLFARESAESFRVPETYVALNRSDTGVTPEYLERQSSRMLFDRPKDVERWSVRFRHGAVRVERFRYAGRPEEEDDETPRPSGAYDAYIVLTVYRGKECSPMYATFQPREGDEASVAVHIPEEEKARELLATLGWVPAPAR